MGHSTSVRLEPEFWEVIDLICVTENISFARLASLVERKNNNYDNLTSNLRILCLRYTSRLKPFNFQEFFK